MRLKVSVFLGAALLLVGVLHPPVHASPLLVFDSASGSVIQAEDAGAPWYPASLTKLMTAFLVFHAIRDGKLTLDSKIEVSANARAQPPSKIGLPVGAKITVGKALEALIVRSANDIAVVLAEGVSGSEEQFVKLMNAWARRLGMTGSYFANPHGLPDPRQVTTARDLGILARTLIREFPEHSKLFTQQDVQIGKRKFRARNNLLREWDEADGMKTGFICASGYNLVASATRNGRRLVAVILGAKSVAVRTQIARKSLSDGFANGSLSGRNVTEYTNGGFFQRTPEDLGAVVCRKSSPVRIARVEWLRGWSAEFGRSSSATDADHLLTDNMLALRNVIYAGRGRVIRDHRSERYVSLLTDLDADQARRVCQHLGSKSIACTVVRPDTYTPPPPPKKSPKKAKRVKKRKTVRKPAAKSVQKKAAGKTWHKSSASK